jgi:hypothetical protein
VPNDGAAPSPPSAPQVEPQSQPQSGTPVARPQYTYARATSTGAASVPISASAMRVREPGTIVAGPYVGNKIPAPRTTLPAPRANGTVVAEARSE